MVSGDSAWLMTATALVLLMTLPGLALFYGGLVRSRNLLSSISQCYAIACLMSLLWMAAGYSIAFGPSQSGIWGGLSKAFLLSVDSEALTGTIPEILFFAFQMTFAIITPALIVGAYVERINFGFVLVFSGLWMLICYAPVAHWIWGGGLLSDGQLFGETGVRDFAGGIVVHETAGIAALVVAYFLGPRRDKSKPPHSPMIVVIGAALLWVGWFGFNGGSQLAADGGAAMAIVATHISAAAASLTWILWERIKYGKASLVGMVTGTIAGLASITPALGFCRPDRCRRDWWRSWYLVPRGGCAGKESHPDRRHARCLCRARGRRDIRHSDDCCPGSRQFVPGTGWVAPHRRNLHDRRLDSSREDHRPGGADTGQPGG